MSGPGVTVMQEGRRRGQEVAGPGVGVGVGTQEPFSEGGAGGAGEGQPQEIDRSSSASWTNTSFFSAGDGAPRKPLTGALSVSGLGLCLAAFVLLLFTLEPRSQTFGIPSLSTSYADSGCTVSCLLLHLMNVLLNLSIFFKSPFPFSLGFE